MGGGTSLSVARRVVASGSRSRSRLYREGRKEGGRERTAKGEGWEGWERVRRGGEGIRDRVSGSRVVGGSTGCNGSGGYREPWILSRGSQIGILQV